MVKKYKIVSNDIKVYNCSIEFEFIIYR